jgi:hypothetical protein
MSIKSKEALELLKRLTAYTTGNLVNDDDFDLSDQRDLDRYQEIERKVVTRLKEGAFDDTNFLDKLSNDEEYFDNVASDLVFAVLNYSLQNPGEDFVQTLAQNTLALRNSLDEVCHKSSFSNLAGQISNLSTPVKTELEDLIGEIVLFNKGYLDEMRALGKQKSELSKASKASPKINRDLRTFLGEKYRKLLAEKQAGLVKIIASRLKDENINGSLKIKGDQEVHDETLKAHYFEDSFAHVASLFYTALTYQAMLPAQAKRNTEFLFQAPGSVSGDPMLKFKQTIKDISTEAPVVDKPGYNKFVNQNIREFKANSTKLIFTALFESLKIDQTGKITGVDEKYLDKFVSGVQRLYKAGLKSVS